MNKPLVLVAEVDIGPVFLATKERRPRGTVLASLHVGDDLNSHRVTEVLLELHLAICAAGEMVAVRDPRARVAALGGECCVVRDAADVLPLRRRAVVRLQKTGVANAVEVDDKVILRDVVARLVEKPAKRRHR